MSDVQQDSTTQPTSDRSGLQAGVDWVGKHWPRMRLGHEGLMLEKIQRQQRCVETVARNTMTGEMADTKGWPSDSEGDKMGVDIGDTITHNHYYRPPVPPTEPSKPATKDKPKPKPTGTLAKLALGAALLGIGAGFGAGVFLLLNAFDKPSPAAEFVDTDTTTSIGIGGGEPTVEW